MAATKLEAPLPDHLLFRLFECIDEDARSARVEGGLELAKSEGERIVVARARLEPMFAWESGRPFVFARADLACDVPPTDQAGDAGDLAWSAARHLGAFAVYRDESVWGEQSRLVACRYHAVFDFETLVLDEPTTRVARVRKHVGWQLTQLSDGLIEAFQREGSGGGPTYGRMVLIKAALVAAFAKHVAAELPVRAEIETVVQRLHDWSLRAVVPMDEVLRVSMEVREARDALRATAS